MEKLKKEKKDLLKYLKQAEGLSRRKRTYTDDEIRKRNTVTKAINRSTQLIRKKMPKLYRHLTHHIKKGTRFVYNIEKPIPWKF